MEEHKNRPEARYTQSSQDDIEKNKTMAIVAYFVFFLPLITDAKNSPFALFHANQSLVLFIAMVALQFTNFIPVVGWFISIVGSIAFLVLWIMGIVSASNGKMTELPIVGSIRILGK